MLLLYNSNKLNIRINLIFIVCFLKIYEYQLCIIKIALIL